MSRYKKIEELLSQLLTEKEKLDCEHVAAKAKLGCHCRRCRTARGVK